MSELQKIDLTDSVKRANYLMWLANKYGDFKVAYMKKLSNGDVICSKHRSVLECSEDKDGFEFLGKSNNRQILSCEIVIDVDPPKNQTFERTKYKFNACVEQLIDARQRFKGFFSGSKGFHIHILDVSLLDLNEYERKKIRTKYLSFMKGIDSGKASEKTMIALEFCPHWKTGNMKELLFDNCLWGIQDELFK